VVLVVALLGSDERKPVYKAGNPGATPGRSTMKIKEYKNKIVIAELNPKCSYLVLFNPHLVPQGQLLNIKSPGVLIQFVRVEDVDKAIRFVEIKKKKK